MSYNSVVPIIDADCFVCVALFSRAVSQMHSGLCLILPIVWKNSVYFCKRCRERLASTLLLFTAAVCIL